MNITPFDVFHVTPLKRISASKIILEAVKISQSKDGEPDFLPEILAEYGNFINCLCEAGFIRKVENNDGGFPYRLTWKGLCFHDAITELENLTKNNIPLDSVQGCLTHLAVFSFH